MLTKMEFPTLYAHAINGKIKQWDISVTTLDTIVVRVSHGYIDGKKTVAERTISAGKNIGKKNETSALQQAINEATSKWNGKKDDGFSEESDNISKVIRPMLAHDYSKHGNKIKFPCMVQPKLDGVRAYYDNGALYSRTGKEFGGLDHILNELKGSPLRFDGELYSHELTFQEIVGLVKKKQINTEKIYLYVYDIIAENMTFKDRHAKLIEFFASHPNIKNVKLLKTDDCDTVGSLKPLHDTYVADNYEGLIIRNIDGLYAINARSTNLQKFKEFLDDEFTVTGFADGEGVEAGLVLWVCETKDGKKFTVRPRGTHEDRAVLFSTGASYVGKLLTVRFQEYTNDGIPRFPIGIGIREDGL